MYIYYDVLLMTMQAWLMHFRPWISKQVWFLEEEKLPLVSSAVAEDGKHKILMKSPWEFLQRPIGSGGVISLLSSQDSLLDELCELGVEYVQVRRL